MKKALIILSLFLSSLAGAQNLTLQDCYDAARNNSPISKQLPNLNQVGELQVKSLTQSKLPHLFINGQYTYQSDVVSLPDLPGFAGPDIPKNQYRVSLDVNQNLFSGGRVGKTVAVQNEKLKADLQEVEVQLASIKKPVNDLYFSTLSLQEMEKLYDVILADLNERKGLIQSLVRNGVMRSGDEKALEIEIKKVNQEKMGAHYQKLASLEMLATTTGLDLNEATNLALPDQEIDASSGINREEKKLFEYSRNTLEVQKNLSNISRYPSLSAFGSLGVGNPNPMNFFETGASSFYIVGVKLNWNIWDWNESKRNKEILRLQQINITEQENNFDQNIERQLAGASINLNKLKELLKADQEILDLQTSITEEAFARYQRGVITYSEYSSELNKKINAQLKLALRKIEISKETINILTVTGNI